MNGEIVKRLSLLLMVAVAALAGAGEPRAVLELDGGWWIKPAESPEIPPGDSDWGVWKIPSGQKFQDGIDASGTSWKKQSRKTFTVTGIG